MYTRFAVQSRAIIKQLFHNFSWLCLNKNTKDLSGENGHRSLPILQLEKKENKCDFLLIILSTPYSLRYNKILSLNMF